MSIPFIFGWGKNSKEVGYIGLHKCAVCSDYSHFTIHEVANNVKVYFIPIAKFNKKRYVVCQKCQNGWELDEVNYLTLMKTSMTALSKEKTLELWNSISNSVVSFFENGANDDFEDYLLPIFEKYGNSEFVHEHINRFINYIQENNEKEEQ